METFPVLYFSYLTRYPESGTRIQFGNSYQYDALPEAPDQRIFVLSLQGMAYFVDVNGDVDATIQPERNLARLEEFYNVHKRAKPFTLNHPVYGAVTVKFSLPLEIPTGIAAGNGNVDAFDVELIEQP